MQIRKSFLVAAATGILLALPMSSAQAWWGWGPGSWWDGDGWGGFGFSFGFHGSGWGRNRWYRRWYDYPYYGYPYYGTPYLGYAAPLAYPVYQPVAPQPTTSAEK